MTSKSAAVSTVHPRDDSALDDELRLRVVRPVRRDESELRHRRDELLEVQIARRARCEAAASHPRGASAPRTPRRPRGRTLRVCTASYVVESGRPRFQLGCRRAARPKRRVDLEQELVGDGSELGGPLEVVGELRRGPPRGRLRPAGATSPASRGSRRARACRRESRRASRRRAATPPGVVTRSGPPGAERGSRGSGRRPLRRDSRLRCDHGQRRAILGEGGARHGRIERDRRRRRASTPRRGRARRLVRSRRRGTRRRARRSRATWLESADVEAAVAQTRRPARPDRRSRLLRGRTGRVASRPSTSPTRSGGA